MTLGLNNPKTKRQGTYGIRNQQQPRFLDPYIIGSIPKLGGKAHMTLGINNPKTRRQGTYGFRIQY